MAAEPVGVLCLAHRQLGFGDMEGLIGVMRVLGGVVGSELTLVTESKSFLKWTFSFFNLRMPGQNWSFSKFMKSICYFLPTAPLRSVGQQTLFSFFFFFFFLPPQASEREI